MVIENNEKKKICFPNCMFGIVSNQVHSVILILGQCNVTKPGKKEKKKKKKPHSTQFFWKLICDPLMKSSSFRIKLNVQRYLSVGISLITQREASDRLMQVLTWASSRTLYMYPAMDRYC